MAKKIQRYETQMQLFDPKSNLAILSEVPIRPKIGFQYIFKWEDKLKRQEWRVDGFRWRQYSTVTFKYGDVDCKRYHFKLQVGPGNKFTTDFTRHAIECPLYENKILIWYQGDDSLAVDAALKDAKDSEKDGKAPQRFETQMQLFQPEANLPILNEVPLRPKGGFKYIFKWDIPLKRQDWRVDGYRWRQNTMNRFSYHGVDSKRYYFKLQVGHGNEFSMEFTKNAIECPLHENQVLVWYQGDETVARDFAHGNSKDPEKEYHRTAPSVLKKIQMETETEKDGKAPQRFETQMQLFQPEANLPILNEVPLRPKGGFKYIFKWEIPLKRQDWRVDGYRWRQNTMNRFSYHGVDSKRYYFKLQVGHGDEFSMEFTKNAIECPLHENQVLVWYQGDETVARDFAHGNSKDPEKEYHRTAPSVLKKIQMETETEKLPLQVYSDLLTDCSNRARLMIDAPRDVKQVQNARKFIPRAERSINDSPKEKKQIRNTPKVHRKIPSKAERSSHDVADAIYNLYSCETDFVSDFQIAPYLLIICFDKNTVSELREFIKRDDLTTQCLTYDTTFAIGELYLSVLTFRQPEFEDNPVIPLMYMIYERDVPEVHNTFFMRFAEAVPEFSTPQRMIITSNEEVAITNAIAKHCPDVPRLRCWQHALQNIKLKLQIFNITERQEVQQYESDFIRLLNQDSAGKYKSLLAQMYLKRWKKEFSDYFDMAIDPDMNRMGAWALRPFGISLQTATSSESFSGIMKRLSETNWNKSSVDLLASSLLKITDFFNVRVARSRYRLADYAYTLKASLNDFYGESDCDVSEAMTVEQLMDAIKMSRTETASKGGRRTNASTFTARRYAPQQIDSSMEGICILESNSVDEADNSSIAVEHVILVDEAELDQDTVMYICH
uniref:MULE transposase domain-containing protein n=1 Tax=Daphnia galeata TaxID=27404 RepID=A0A8J2W4W5_9CRUS|nr:unnamed protein product [Daphnia galeata]